ncbi:hypothetical protein D3C84_513000 [compost metagenome]
MGATEVAGPDAGGEAELGVVGDRQGFGFILETDHRGDRAEDFLLHDFHRVAVALEQGRLVVPAVTLDLWTLAAQAQFRPFGQGVGDQALDHGQLLRGGHRAHLAAVILRVADTDALGPFDQALDEFVVDLVLHQQARAGHAALPRCGIDAGDRAVDRTVQVGVGEDDVRRLAAQFQRQLGEVLGAAAHHVASGGGAAGEGDLAHQRVTGQGGAGAGAVTGDHVDHARRNAGLQGQARQFENGRRGVLGRLDDHAVAGGQRRGQLDCGEVQRAVPGNDRRHYAERLEQGVAEHIALIQRQGTALEFVGQPGGVIEEFRQVADLAAGFADQLAIVAALQLRQLLLVLGDQVAQAAQQLAPCGGAQVAPGRTFEGLLRRLDRALHVGFVGIGQLRPGFGEGRVEAVERPAGQGIDPLAVDAHLKTGECHATIPCVGFSEV